MSIDDDIYLPCSDVHKAFEVSQHRLQLIALSGVAQVWRENKRALVGFFPRSHRIDEDCR